MDTPIFENILIVDDHELFRERLARSFRERGYEVRTAEDAVAARKAIQERQPTKMILDLRMPGESGLEALQDLKDMAPQCEILILTGYGSITTAVDAMRQGAYHYMPKPADADEILEAFRKEPSGSTKEPLHTPSLARTEWEHINRVLADCNGNISQAARALGIHRRSLQRKLQKFPPND